MNLPRGELAVQRWLEMVKEVQETRRSNGTEQWQRLSPTGGCGGLWRNGAMEARRRARRWWNLVAFHVLFGGGAIPATLTSWTEAQSTMKSNRGRNRDGGRRWWREDAAFAREKMNSDGFARFGTLNKRYGLSSVNTRGIKCYRPRSFATRGQIIYCQWQFCNTGGHWRVIGFGWCITEA